MEGSLGEVCQVPKAPPGRSGRQLTETQTDGVSGQARGRPAALPTSLAGSGVISHLGFSSKMRGSPRREGCRAAGGSGDKAEIKPVLSVKLTSALHSASLPGLPGQLSPSLALSSSVDSELIMGCIRKSLPNSPVASCAASPQLDEKLGKAHASPPVGPLMSKQI